MRLQIQPNNWSCLPTALAIILDEPLSSVIRAIGHDGSEIVWPNLSEPDNRRGFHVQEIIDITIQRDRSVALIEVMPLVINNPYLHLLDLEAALDQYDLPKARVAFEMLKGRLHPCYKNTSRRLEEYMTKYDGIVMGTTRTGSYHAVAWDHLSNCYYDPGGDIVTIKTGHAHINISNFLIVN